MNEPTKEGPRTRPLSIVLPVRNCAASIEKSLEGLCRLLETRPPGDWEILVVDDASGDATAEQVIEFSRSHPQVLLLHNPSALGVGYAARHGVLLSQGERILLSAVDPPEPWSVLPPMEERLADRFDLVVASDRTGADRMLPPVRIRREFLRHIVPSPRRADGRARRPNGLRFHLYRRDAALEIYRRQRIDGPSFAIESLYLARRFQYRVLEAGIPQLLPSATGSTGHGGSDVGIGDLIRIRYNRLRGFYG